MKKKLLVISVDCLSGHDLARGNHMPRLREMMDRGTTIRSMKSIYPTVTYPAHASIITGCLPNKTGLIANERLMPGKKNPDWFWEESENHALPLYRAAKLAGYTVGMAHWPVTAGAKVDVNLAEIWTEEPDGDYKKRYLDAGCNPAREAELIDRLAGIHSWRNHPQFDAFAHAAALAMLKEDRLDVVLLHTAYLDAAHHREGNDGASAVEAMKQEDTWLAEMIDQVTKNGDEDNTLIAIISDHGSMDYTRVFKPNVLLLRAGFAKEEAGAIKELRAWTYSGGGCAIVKVYHQSDEPEALKLLLCAMENPEYGIESVKTAKEAFGFDPADGTFVIEMKPGFAVTAKYEGDALDEISVRATHGYLPEKGPQPLAVFAGPGVKKGEIVEQGNIIDIAPTLAKWLDIALPDADGCPLPIFEQ